jgi:hypothetical protein
MQKQNFLIKLIIRIVLENNMRKKLTLVLLVFLCSQSHADRLEFKYTLECKIIEHIKLERDKSSLMPSGDKSRLNESVTFELRLGVNDSDEYVLFWGPDDRGDRISKGVAFMKYYEPGIGGTELGYDYYSRYSYFNISSFTIVGSNHNSYLWGDKHLEYWDFIASYGDYTGGNLLKLKCPEPSDDYTNFYNNLKTVHSLL